MPAFYKDIVSDFLKNPSQNISGQLSESVIRSFSGDESLQLAAWKEQIELLKSSLREAAKENDAVNSWGILFEYPMLRLQRRLDIVLLAGRTVVVIEFKVGAASYGSTDFRQVEDYALDLRVFHSASHHLPILPVLCATRSSQSTASEIPMAGVGDIWACNSNGLIDLFRSLLERQIEKPTNQFDTSLWDSAPYKPVPTIIEAAELLFAGHEVREVASASSDTQNLSLALCDKAFQDFSFVIHGPPKIMRLAIDLHENLIQVPLPVRVRMTIDPTFPKISSKQRSKPVPPKANCLVADLDAAFMQQILHIPQRQRETHIHHHRQADDLWRRLEIPKGAVFCHSQTLRDIPARLK